jgi:hypothetical protein
VVLELLKSLEVTMMVAACLELPCHMVSAAQMLNHSESNYSAVNCLALNCCILNYLELSRLEEMPSKCPVSKHAP